MTNTANKPVLLSDSSIKTSFFNINDVNFLISKLQKQADEYSKKLIELLKSYLIFKDFKQFSEAYGNLIPTDGISHRQRYDFGTNAAIFDVVYPN